MNGRNNHNWCTDHCGPGSIVRRLGEYEILKCRHHGRYQVFHSIDGIISINNKSIKEASKVVDADNLNCYGY